MSTAYHPQSDGQTEIVNKALQQYLHCFVHTKPKEWGHYIHWAEWHYNSSIHTATGITPFQAVYGKPPPSLPMYIAGTSHIEAVDSELTNRTAILEKLRKKLSKAQQTLKLYADKRRIPHTFKKGDSVFVKLRPYKQTSMAGHRVHKLAQRYYGPFKIINTIGDVAFELQLPPTSKIHPVFHVSKLKHCSGDSTPSLELPLEDNNNQPLIQPVAILNWQRGADPSQTKVLIQWSGTFPEDATWEFFEELKQSYPHLHLEDKVPFDGGRDVIDPTEDEGADQSNWDKEPRQRSKRNRVRPKWRNDYVTP